MVGQSVLPFAVSDETSFNSFCDQGNEALLREVLSLLNGERVKRVIYLWGEQGSGKTHLLNACCHYVKQRNQHHLYLPMGQGLSRFPSLERLKDGLFMCIDDAQNLAGNPIAQESVFSFYEQLTNHAGALIVSATLPPAALDLELKDLESRLTSGGVFNLHKLSDSAKVEALKLRAHKRGFELEDKVLDFIMTHYDRNTSALFALLERIDRASLAEHRKVTIPFIKTLL